MTREQQRDEWVAARPAYERLRDAVTSKLKVIAREVGVVAEVSGRTKDLRSYIKKCIAKGYADPMSQMPDKMGCRITVPFPQDVEKLLEQVNQCFNVTKQEVRGLEDERMFGYSGVHFDICYRSDDPGEPGLTGLTFELQVHTGGQSLWASTAHKLAYKTAGTPAAGIVRRINRLSALLEIFDREIMETRHEVLGDESNRIPALLSVLEEQYLQFTGRETDSELSLLTVTALRHLLPDGSTEQIAAVLAPFVTEARSKLVRIYADYDADDRCSAFLFQPEAIAIFYLLSKDRFALRDAWQAEFPLEGLEEMAAIWGLDIGNC